MLHAPPTTLRTQRRFIARQRFNLLGALVATALLPFLLRALILPQDTFYAASINALIFNALAVLIAFWTRLSIETYPETDRPTSSCRRSCWRMRRSSPSSC